MAETGAENMKFFLSYLNQRKHSIIVFILFSAVFSVSFILYDITPLAVVYPALLCAFLGERIKISIKRFVRFINTRII